MKTIASQIYYRLICILLFSMGFTFSCPIAYAASQHPNPIEASRPIPPAFTSKSKLLSLTQPTSNYCPSWGGSTAYESISNVQVNRLDADVLQFVVDVFIANPTGCTAGNPCPEYDDSPEYINAWIDWNGNSVFEAGEKVLDNALYGYLNINYQGTMTTTGQATIPPGAKSSTYLRVNLGWGYDPNDPCIDSWEWGNVVDRPVEIATVKVLKIDALNNDVSIRDITNPVWQKTFDADGDLVDVVPVEDDPIADDMTSGFFTIKATLGSHPSQPAWMPKVAYQWSIQGYPAYNGSSQFIGWEGQFNISTPQRVGQYILNLGFTISDNLGNIITQNQLISKKLYVTYDKPILPSPKEKWINKATLWGNIAVGPYSAALFLNTDIYAKSGWLYRDGPLAVSWEALVEENASQGNCVSFSNVWDSLSKVLGVAGTSVQRTSGQSGKGFLTKPASSLPPESLAGNARPQVGPVDRWMFKMHQVGLFGGTYFDSTFGKMYSGLFDFIEWHATGNTGSDAFGNYLELTGGHKTYFRSSPTAAKPWGEWEYHSPVVTMPVAATSSASFTGNFNVAGVDSEGTGYYSALKINAEIKVEGPGEYSIMGVLRQGTETISFRPSYNSMGFTSTHVHAIQAGASVISLSFSGEDVYRRGLNGVYTVDLTIYDANGQPLASQVFSTPSYTAAQFREVPAIIESATDFGEDTNGNGLFDALVADVSVSTIRAGRYDITGNLSVGSEIISAAGTSLNLSVGNNNVKLRFDGQKIRNSRKDGPYKLELSVSDGVTSSTSEFTTATYAYTEFGNGLVDFTGSLWDFGMDLDGDGLYNKLGVELDVYVIRAGMYKTMAWLNDGNGEFVAYAESENLINTGNQTILLKFDGGKIYAHGVDGPYILNYAVVYDENDMIATNIARDVHTTNAYSYTEFQQAAFKLIALTGNYLDAGIDTDGDGYYDLLRIQVEAITSANGNAIANARLVDAKGNELQWVSGNSSFLANSPGMISLDFDGRLIYANAENGPYYLKNLNVYHTGDPTQNVYQDEAYITNLYDYRSFEATAVIRGVVVDKGQPVAGALISIPGEGFNYSGTDGRYHIAVMQPGEYQVSIEKSGYTSWKIYKDGVFLKDGNFLSITVQADKSIQIDFMQQSADSDGDGINDNIDNCPDVPNSDQTDIDGDGAGNLCDPDENGDGIIDGDLNGDNKVDVNDYKVFQGAFGKCKGNPKYNPQADYDGSGCINFIDYQIWYQYYNKNKS